MYIKKIDFEINTLKEFKTIIDVRTPLEYFEDHVPNSINLPVLNNIQRKRIGETYKNNPFEARKVGAKCITKNISEILKNFNFSNKEKILIYCWRGGLRSRSFYIILKSIGFNVSILEKGYKSYRQFINNYFKNDVKGINFNVLSGLTGTGKTFFLKKLSEYQNVLDIEKLANHKGSILGDLPNKSQPSQKKFESLIWYCLHNFKDKKKKIWVESESNRIGKLFIPNSLFKKMITGKIFKIEVPFSERVKFILKDYNYLVEDNKIVYKALKIFKRFMSKENLRITEEYYRIRNFKEFVKCLLKFHYDIVYKKNSYHNQPTVVKIKSVSEKSFKELLDYL